MFAKFLKSIRSDQSQDEPLRWIVLDVETTGLDPASDRLLAIAAIAIQVGPGFTKPAIVLGDSYEAVIKQDLASDRDNILIHHIGVGAQESGSPANEAWGMLAAAGVEPAAAVTDWNERTPVGAFKLYGETVAHLQERDTCGN